MAKRGKKYKTDLTKVDRTKRYTLDEAFTIIGGFSPRKIDETIDVAVRLGVDPKQSDQMVRGATTLPNGVGKSIRVVAIVRGEAEKEAKAAGADHVGADDLIEKIAGGWLDFDRVVTTPETLKDLTKVAKILGPKGLMPNKKTGTVTSDVGKTVREQKLGTVEFKVEKAGIIHALIGKKSFGPQKLKENFLALFDVIMKAKPPTSKGVYVQKVSVSPTMGPGVWLDTQSLENVARGL